MTENVSDNPTPERPQTIDRQCKKHGPYVSVHLYAGIYEPCVACMNENEAARKLDEAEEPKVDPQATRRLVAGISKRFEDSTFETYVAEEERQRSVFTAVQGYAINFREHYKAGRCMVMLGRPGTGKSHLGYSILRHCMDASPKFTGRMVAVSELFRSIKAAYAKGARTTEGEAIAKLVAPHLLIVDEIGVQFDSVTEQQLLYEVVNERYKEMLPTVVISNLSRAELVEIIGNRTFDRLRENGGLIIPFDWESHRTRKP